MQRNVRRQRGTRARPESTRRSRGGVGALSPELGVEDIPKTEHLEEEGTVVGGSGYVERISALKRSRSLPEAMVSNVESRANLGLRTTSKPIRLAVASMVSMSSSENGALLTRMVPTPMPPESPRSWCSGSPATRGLLLVHVPNNDDPLPRVLYSQPAQSGAGQGGQPVDLARPIPKVPPRHAEDASRGQVLQENVPGFDGVQQIFREDEGTRRGRRPGVDEGQLNDVELLSCRAR